MNIFRKLLRFLSGRAPVPFADLQADAAMFARAGFDSSNLALLKLDKLDAKDPQTIYGLGVKIQERNLFPVFVASNSGYVIATKLLASKDPHDFLRAVAARVVTDAGEKFPPGLWTWTQLPVDASIHAPAGRPMGCLPDAALFVSQRTDEGWKLVYAGEHAFAIRLDTLNHSVWVWPGSGFSGKEILTENVKEAVERVFKFQVRGINYLNLPTDGRQP